MLRYVVPASLKKQGRQNCQSSVHYVMCSTVKDAGSESLATDCRQRQVEWWIGRHMAFSEILQFGRVDNEKPEVCFSNGVVRELSLSNGWSLPLRSPWLHEKRQHVTQKAMKIKVMSLIFETLFDKDHAYIGTVWTKGSDRTYNRCCFLCATARSLSLDDQQNWFALKRKNQKY